jgi:hypothetical protein
MHSYFFLQQRQNVASLSQRHTAVISDAERNDAKERDVRENAGAVVEQKTRLNGHGKKFGVSKFNISITPRNWNESPKNPKDPGDRSAALL